jgi:hypothetical protein
LIRPLPLATFLVLLPSSAFADASLLAGFQGGGSISRVQAELTPHFRIGAGLDLLFDGGLLFASRIDTTHEIDSTLALLAGWAGSAHRTNEGLPLAIALGGALAVDRLGNPRGGMRAILSLSLWYSRATLEADATVLEALTRDARFLRGTSPEVAVGLAIRFVPFSAWRF